MAAQHDRNVRPRGPAPPPAAPAVAPPRAAPDPPPVSPLVRILEAAVRAQKVVKDVSGDVYTGFASYADLAESQCAFVPMNSNRAINREVVQQRVKENEDAFTDRGAYLEFGQINLLVVSTDATHDFLVMDGQHRCETMQRLYRLYPQREIWFQFRAKVVKCEEQAFEELRHFQRAYPTDVRSFFNSRAEARAATAVLERLKEKSPQAFKEMRLADQHGRRTGDPVRPFLNDNLLFWLLQDAQLLAAAGEASQDTAANAAAAFSRLEQMDRHLSRLPLNRLGKTATEKMRITADRNGCWLGFFRDNVLNWKDVADGLPRPEPRPQAPPRPAAQPGAPPDCVVCLERAQEWALAPCGHRCVCEECARAVCARRPQPTCPVCRGGVSGCMRIFMP